MKKLSYISNASAISIIAVVINHLDITGTSFNPDTPIANSIEKFGTFQMPMFMCISGFLFVNGSGYNMNYKTLVKSKINRLIIPFLFLSLITLFFKLCLPSSMLEHGVEFTKEYIFRMLFIPFRGPVPHSWFLISLFTIFILSPFYKWTILGSKPIIITLILFVLLQYGFLGGSNHEVFAIDKTCQFLLYFYVGMVICKYDMLKCVGSLHVTICFLLLYLILLYWISIPYVGSLLTALLGILFVFSLSKWLASNFPMFFRSWRDYTYQIYLWHMYPIMACKYIYKKHLIIQEDVWFTLVWIFALIMSITLPSLLAVTSKKFPSKFRILIGM